MTFPAPDHPTHASDASSYGVGTRCGVTGRLGVTDRSGTTGRGMRHMVLAGLCGMALTLSACGNDNAPAPVESPTATADTMNPTAEPTQAVSSSQAEPHTSSPAPDEHATSASATNTPGASAEPATSTATSQSATPDATHKHSAPRTEAQGTAETEPADAFPGRGVGEAYESFHTLAPRSLFEQFDSCMPNGVPGSAACSGPEVGQFQFFASDAKAASTTQLLTELRSSRVVKDSGAIVVGWSTLGSTAIVTVVDNDNGVLLQHMVSTDKRDPRDIIDTLHLADMAR